MSDFINTIDRLGDDVVFNSIVEGSLIEFKDDVLTQVGGRAFSTSALVEVDLPNVLIVRTYGFPECANLLRVNLPNATSIDTYAFNSSRKLEYINIPNVTTIGNSAFAGYGMKLKTLDLPKVTSIGGENALGEGSANLTEVILRSETMCTLGGASNVLSKSDCFIYVPKALIEEYKLATNWSTYANQFRALEDYTVDGTIDGELDESKI